MNKKVFTAAAMFVLVAGLVAMISPANSVYAGQYGHGHGKGKGNSHHWGHGHGHGHWGHGHGHGHNWWGWGHKRYYHDHNDD